MQFLMYQEKRDAAEEYREQFKANAFLMNPELALKVWPLEDEVEEEEEYEPLTAEEIEQILNEEKMLREKGFVIIPDA